LLNEPTLQTLLPLSPTGIESAMDETFKLTSEDGKLGVKKEKVPAAKAKKIESDVIFDQPPATILNSMLPLYLNSQLLSILFDAQASELSSRMNAMKAATDNAADLVKTLTLFYNKKRQAGITAEISEISAAAVSLEGGDTAFGPRLGVTDNEETVMVDLMAEIEDGSIPDAPEPPEGPDERFEVQEEFGAAK
jgi:F-type H+-transporting ATPase subunit gamma